MGSPGIVDRFWAKVDKSGDCWTWTAAKLPTGYGVFGVGYRTVYAHRFAYEQEYGILPARLDHRCHNPSCVKPEHLRPVSVKENQEHRLGAQVNSKSGVRGVCWVKDRGWRVQVKHNQINHFGGYFDDLAEAEEAAVALRNRLFTHNDEDRR